VLHRKEVFEPIDRNDGLDLVAAAQRILGRGSTECRRLFVWARIRAEGGSFREYLREAGLPKSSAYHQRDRSLALIARELNREAAGRGSAARKIETSRRREVLPWS
jgi:hypothetical protein